MKIKEFSHTILHNKNFEEIRENEIREDKKKNDCIMVKQLLQNNKQPQTNKQENFGKNNKQNNNNNNNNPNKFDYASRPNENKNNALVNPQQNIWPKNNIEQNIYKMNAPGNLNIKNLI